MTTPPTLTSHPLTLGLDIGGTSTRAVVADLDGKRHGGGRAAGANLTSHAVEAALVAVRSAVSEALAGVDPATVTAAVVGTAGDRNLAVPEVADAFRRTWESVGLRCEFRVVSDAEVAFAAGTAEPDGTLVLSGTGAVSCRIANRRLDHAVDGHGWLLGDQGSGFWLGREAVRVVLRCFDEQRRPGPLGRAVLEQLTGSPETTLIRSESAEMVRLVHTRPPVALAELAPLVTAAADDDAEAARILDEAAAHLARSAALARTDSEADTKSQPLVLAGSLLTTDTPLASRVRSALAVRWPEAPVSVALDGAAGAAWLAALSLGTLDDAATAELHARLVRDVPPPR